MKYIAYSIILIGVFLYGDLSLVLRACLIFGFLSFYPLSHLKENGKNYLYFLLILVPSIALFISKFFHKEALSIKPILLWTAIVILGALLGYLYERIKIKPQHKRSLLISFVMLLIIPLFRKLGEGNYAVLASITYLTAGFIVFKSQCKSSYLSLSLLFGPYILAYLLDAIISDSMQGFLLILPVFALLLLIVLFLFFTDNLKTVRRVGLLLFAVILCPIIWVTQENYANWIYSKNSRQIRKNHIQFTISTDKKLVESSSKRISVFLFTSAYCGNCRKEYPYFSELAKKYSTSDEIGFYGTFLCFKEADTLYYNKLIEQKFDFKWAMAHESSEVLTNLGVDGVPALLILDCEDNVLYSGHCYIRPWIFINSPDIILKNIISSPQTNEQSKRI